MSWFSQNDPRWKGTKLGYGPDTIGADGCLLTSMANIGHFLAGGNTDPLGLNGFFMTIGRWVDGEELTDQALDGCFNCYYEDTRQTPGYLTATDYACLLDDPSQQFVLEIDADIHTPGVQTHFVLWVDGHDANSIRIVDSWDGQVKYLKAYGDPSSIIQKMIRYRIEPQLPDVVPPDPAPVAPTAPVPQPQTPAPAPEPTTAPDPVQTPVAPTPPVDTTPAPTAPQTKPQPSKTPAVTTTVVPTQLGVWLAAIKKRLKALFKWAS